MVALLREISLVVLNMRAYFFKYSLNIYFLNISYFCKKNNGEKRKIHEANDILP